MRYQLQQHNLPVDDAPDDEDIRQTYNFAPGYHGLVYRADVPDYGAGGRSQNDEAATANAAHSNDSSSAQTAVDDVPREARYKLQSMKWGLVPFWTKRNPDYGSVMKTINARDDALASNGGMWHTMKQRKRCVVTAQGFYEWLKKNGGKEKIPHFVKRADEQLMCFAGLWDCVKYEGSDEKHYTYTIITTDSNKQLSFLHDRMPVILENESIRTWLDPGRSEWSKDLQSLLKPYEGTLELYPVNKDVGKVGNNSPGFIIPVASKENKANIANFFSNAQKTAKPSSSVPKGKQENETKGELSDTTEHKVRLDIEERETEDNAPRPEPVKAGTKRVPETSLDSPKSKAARFESSQSPKKTNQTISGKNLRSSTSNGSMKGSPTKSSGSHKISDFFKP